MGQTSFQSEVQANNMDRWNLRCSASVQQGTGNLVPRRLVMKAWSVIGLLFAAAILATIPISPQVTPRGVELSVNQAQAILGHWRRVNRRVNRRAYRRGYYGGYAAPYYGYYGVPRYGYGGYGYGLRYGYY